MEQIFFHGFFQADRHHGNMFIPPAKVACFSDFLPRGPAVTEGWGNLTDLAANNEANIISGGLKVTLQPAEFGGEALGRNLEGLMHRHLFRNLPGRVRTMLLEERRGRLRFEFQHRRMTLLDETLDKVSSRIAFVMVLAALIGGGSVALHAPIPLYLARGAHHWSDRLPSRWHQRVPAVALSIIRHASMCPAYRKRW
ncbi:MAG: hypothetical protein RBT36_08135, partial [Desulfobulbus sp.]|nr:hypothetical protein [Desulfobulbus sp.]